jgi:hypothetical protein
VSWSAQSPNNVSARKRALGAATRDATAAIVDGEVAAAQAAVKRALEAIHELNDCQRAKEWQQAGWSSADLQLWTGHIGARNAAHHSSLPIVTLRGVTAVDDHLVWSADVSSLRYPDQAMAYAAALHGQAVLPLLATIATLVAGSV